MNVANDRSLRVLQVGTVETGGGAASVAGNLMRGYRARGCEAWMAVGRQASDDPNVFMLPDDHRAIFRMAGYMAVQKRLRRMAARVPGSGWGWLSRSLRLATHPRAVVERARGKEDFEFPATYSLLDVTATPPDVVHCHNLHGGYFDLRALRWLSRRVPTVLTLHDAWLLSGHCAHSFDCERWMTGCGECPDLTIYPAIRRDATADNWIRKRDIYAGSRLYVTAPSSWLMRKIDRSMLAPAIRRARVIPNGVDLSVFRPSDKRSVRARLGIAADDAVVLLTAQHRTNPWRDHLTLRRAIESIAARLSGQRVLIVGVGDDAAALGIAGMTVRAVPDSDPRAMAQHYQAADVYVHAARADTFPTSILEALACGTPVVATAVGGIPEQIKAPEAGTPGSRAFDQLTDATGALVPAGNPEAMADAIATLLSHRALRCRLGDNAVRDVRERFDLNRQVESYLAWYRTIIEHWNGYANADGTQPPAAAAREGRMALD